MALVTLTVVSNQLEAEMLCGELRANGIPCSHETTSPAAALGIYAVGQAGPTAVMVDETQLEEARHLLPNPSVST
jgi:Putative prokaryotic signal transducing protein